MADGQCLAFKIQIIEIISFHFLLPADPKDRPPKNPETRREKSLRSRRCPSSKEKVERR